MSQSSMNSSSYGPKSESTNPSPQSGSRTTSASSRPKLTRSKRFDADDGTDFANWSSSSSASTTSTSSEAGSKGTPAKDSGK